jgi:predicted ATPase
VIPFFPVCFNRGMQARLLERDSQLHLLREALTQAGRGRGSVVLVSGEAGIGKTSLVRAFAAGTGADTRVLIGGCDDLVTPRTLGPFRDMAQSADGPLAEAVRPGPSGTRSSPPRTGSWSAPRR